MAFVHCHTCGWQQDDFWSESYNPLKSLLDWQRLLLEGDLDGVFINEEGDDMTNRELLARECERAAKTIRNMEWRTDEEMRKDNPGRHCPMCGDELDID